MVKNYIFKSIIYNILSMIFLFSVLLILSSCETGTDDSKLIQVPVVVKPSDTLVNKPIIQGPSVDSIKSLDLQSISFKPSNVPLSFGSTAFGDLITGSTERNKISLTNAGWTHPSVMYFAEEWNGYHYWCAITPYPGSDSQYENAHIFCSNDGINWSEPTGSVNPIEYSPVGTAYSSDVNLMFKDGYLYCYWRDNGIVVNGASRRALLFKKSSDGVNWTPKEIVASWPTTGIDVIAPSILRDQDAYYCYGVCNGETTPGSYYTQYAIRRTASASERKFIIDRNKAYELINILGRPWGEKQEPWHIDVQKMGNVWLMLVTTTDNGQYGSSGRLFLGYSFNGTDFNFDNKPICNSVGTYKSAFVPTYDRQNKRIKFQLWRTQTANNWQVFYDEFFVSIK
ncbi:hypothetical protein [Flavobacterium sp. KACC 22761]|uniref:hypothetical protein n=1 Tax=Flavobacterium sp. KACC 22761 TaxID=3092665 RepID=UPI002A76271F|nr:hypothetical protein [Flavobacterium sp. KACC 22761]WPO79087.1 hypothetical protein SCB73_01580 [Flavobacterium sp. KACC 22761]